MTDPLTTVVVRTARPTDIASLEAIENAADELFLDLVGPDAWDPAVPGDERAATPGFILVATEVRGGAEDRGETVGFAHVLEVDGEAHLEQLAVLPDRTRRGIGRSLVDAAKAEASRRGYDRLTLRTYADVPWNAPFYATCGFTAAEPATPFQHGLVAVESRIGLERHGRRVLMEARLVPSRPS